MPQPLFSIIMAAFNAEKTIERSLGCVRNQQFRNFELIVVDGGSTDGSLEIIARNKDSINYWISEPDKGIYDAWNKGLQRAKGEWILFIGTDDYLRPDALFHYNVFLQKQDMAGVLYISSKVQIVSPEGVKKRVFGWPWQWQEFRYKPVVAHPGSLHHRSLFEKYGVYNTGYQIAGDYELLLRPKEQLNARFLDAVTVDMTDGGVSNRIKTSVETRKAQLGNCVSTPILINIEFLSQFVKIIGKRLLGKLGLSFYLRREFRG
ncbi:glycosyltransferase family 2 protein [Flavisolibacter nicotianae]|uniref:glycosyltransferase family 2 protein n=1 Tax=Flavisolibacter nicotianae TaxID=2364882 RepID=UPI000EAD43FB|nr:glycosyltransferase family 2 protein [Flavisolibacter nicotianae]